MTVEADKPVGARPDATAGADQGQLAQTDGLIGEETARGLASSGETLSGAPVEGRCVAAVDPESRARAWVADRAQRRTPADAPGGANETAATAKHASARAGARDRLASSGPRPRGRLMGLRIAMIGTRGVPARYGGFETAVEEIGRRLADRGHEVTVYCRGGSKELREHLGMRLVHLPAVKHKIAETLSHTALSVLHRDALRADVALLFNAANAPLLPVLQAARVPTAVHVDGLEWKRSKWSGAGRRYYLMGEKLAVRWGDALIADAVGIQDYYRSQYGVDSVFIPYGAPIQTAPALHRLTELELAPRSYHLVVARFEPENHVHLVIAGYLRADRSRPLVVVGTAPYADTYIADVERLAARNPEVRLLGGLWDQELLDALYAGALTYVHGHSVGGTNPSLLRAMGAAAPVLAYDVVFNREVLTETGRFWSSPADLAALLADAEREPGRFEQLGRDAQDRAAQAYAWDDVASQYEALCASLTTGGR